MQFKLITQLIFPSSKKVNRRSRLEDYTMYHIFDTGEKFKQQYYITKLMSLRCVTRTLQMISVSTGMLTFLKAKIVVVFILMKWEPQI